MELRLHVVEAPVERCVDCPSAKSPINEINGEWRCKQAAELDDKGNITGHRIIPMVEAWHGFPAWCPLVKTTQQKWSKKVADRKIQYRAAGRVGRINPPAGEDW
jgi:hypothetical protein